MNSRLILRQTARSRLLATSFLVPLALGLSSPGALAADLGIVVDRSAPPVSSYDEPWNGWGSFGGAWNSETESFGEFVIFSPLWQDSDSLLFGEARGRFFEDELLAGNAAIGVRQMTNSGFNLGAWVGLDVFNSVSDNTFGQVSGGIEALSTYFDFRANGYLPFTDPKIAADGVADVVLTGPDGDRRGEIYMIGGKEVAAYGGDVEAGLRLPFGDNIGHFGVYGGGYFYDADGLEDSVVGGMARVELARNDVVGAGSRLTAGYRYTDDNVNGDNHSVGARLRIPFSGAPALASQSQQWQRMIDPLERNPNIHIGQSEREAVADGYTEVRFDRVAYSSNNDDLDDDITDTLANTLLILDGATVSQKTLEPMQTLAGGGSMLKVQGVDSGAVSYASIPGARPTISNANPSGYALTLAGYNTVNGVDVVSQRLATSAINAVTLGGIDGSGDIDVVAIVDTSVTVSMEATGGNGGSGETGDAGIIGSTLYGINLNGVDTAWINDSLVDVSMTGIGGDGGDDTSNVNASVTQNGDNNVAIISQGPDVVTAGDGGDGVTGQSSVYGIALNDAENVWLNNTTTDARMAGTGGAGGTAAASATSTITQTGNNNSVTNTQTFDSVTAGNGGNGVTEQSSVYGIALNGAENVWLNNTTAEAWMTGTGGAGGAANVSATSTITQTGSGNTATVTQTFSGMTGGNGGNGVTEQSSVYGIALNDAENVWLNNTMTEAWMTGNGGAGGAVDVFSGGTTTQNGSGNSATTTVNISADSGTGGVGLSDSTLHGIDLTGSSNASLMNTTVTATMTGNGGAGGDHIGGFVPGGRGGNGILNGTVYGIDLSFAEDVTLEHTSVIATQNGTGGAGGDGRGGGQGGSGVISCCTVYGINLIGAQGVWLGDTTVEAGMIGIGGNGGNSVSGGEAGRGGTGVHASAIFGIDLLGATDIWIYDTKVLATMTGTGGSGGTGFTGGAGGDGVFEGRLFGIRAGGSTVATLENTTVDATMTGNGGNGGASGGAGGTGISGASQFDWINPDPVPPSVILIDPPTFLGSLPISNDGANGGP